MNQLFKMLNKILGKGIPVSTILEFFALNLAWILALAVPMAVLIATLSTFGRMSGDNEITALRASGVSPIQLMIPAIFWALLITIWVAWFNNYVLPDWNHRTKLLQIDISRKKPTFMLEPNIYNFDIPNYVLHSQQVDQENATLYDVTIYDEHVPSKRSTIAAKKGRLEFVPIQEAIILTLLDGEIHRPSMDEDNPNGYEHTRFDSALFRLKRPGMSFKRKQEGWKGDRELSVQQLLERIDQIADKTDPYSIKRVSQYQVEIHKKFSIPVACLVFILIGAPLGIMSQKGGIGVSGSVSLLFFSIYWMFLGGGEDLADRSKLSPALSMWLANIVFTIVGFWMIWLAQRSTSFPGVRFVSNLISQMFATKIESDKKPDDEKSFISSAKQETNENTSSMNQETSKHESQ